MTSVKDLLHTFLKRILVILLCSYLVTASSLDTLYIGDTFTEASIENFGYVFIEDKDELNFEKIKNLPDSAFLPVSETGVYFPPANQLHWLKYHIKNNTEEETDLLLVCRNMTINELHIFTQDEQGHLSKSALTGDFHKFSTREIGHRFYLFEIRIPPGEARTYYAFVNKYRNNLWLQFKVEDREIFFNEDRIRSFFEVLYLGMILAASLISLIFVGFNKQSIFLYFSAYCFVTTLWIFYAMGYGFKYIWFDFQDFNNYASIFCNTLHTVIMTALTRAYLDTKKYLPRADKALGCIQYFFLFFFFYNLFSSFMPRSWDTTLLRSNIIAQLIYPITIIWITITAYLKSGLKEQLVFLMAFLFTFIGLICLSMLYMGLLGNDFLTQYFLYWLFGLDVLTLTYLLSKRIKDTFSEKILLQAKLNELKINAAEAIIQGQQQERKRLSTDLHDGLSLKLAIIKMRLSSVFSVKSEKKQRAEVEILLNQLGIVSDDLRSFTHELSPIDLREQTLEEAINDLIYVIQDIQTDIEIELRIEEGIERRLNDLQSHIIYQVVQELLNNTLKHSKASNVEVRLASDVDSIILSSKDNGVGFDFEKKKNGIGLKNIRLRAEFLSGNFVINSNTSGSHFLFSFSI